MTQEQWTKVDGYFGQALLPPDAVLQSALAANSSAGLPAIDVSPPQGKFLYLLAKIHGARRILEIGTLGGYSTICMARALPRDGLLVTLEAEPKHAEVARQNIERAGLAGSVRIIIGKALDSLPKLKAEAKEAFDLIFIDADKPNTPEYYRWALELSRPGTVIIADNVVRKGEVANPDSSDPNVQGMRRLIEVLSKDRKVEVTAIQTVGAKGYDGFVMARVL
ncbi:MAG TPA: O-methyltransferase [Opitutaceae bacterium]|jgi:predicted O-methyltransferase YrrM|nr:O-methyltransferase [Opitutaceae bacterium]